MASRPQYRCPQCGSNTALYRRADVLWNPVDAEWQAGEMEKAVDCLECDHTDYISEFEIKDSSNDFYSLTASDDTAGDSPAGDPGNG